MTEWSGRCRSKTVPEPILTRITHLRRLMLVHCHLYYNLDVSVVDDHTWQRWAEELTDLQAQHGHAFGFYDRHFFDWDASTGYHLPQDQDIDRVARRVLARHPQART